MEVGSTTNIDNANTENTEYASATWMIIPGRSYKVYAYFNDGKADRTTSVDFKAVAWPDKAEKITDIITLSIPGGSISYTYFMTLKDLVLEYKVGEPLILFGRQTRNLDDGYLVTINDGANKIGDEAKTFCPVPPIPCVDQTSGGTLNYSYLIGNGNGYSAYPSEYVFLYKFETGWKKANILFGTGESEAWITFSLKEVSE